MKTFISGVSASLIAGAIPWAATHHVELLYLFRARRRRVRISGFWHSCHLIGSGLHRQHHESSTADRDPPDQLSQKLRINYPEDRYRQTRSATAQ
jgi:hypothetical protein